MKGVAIGSLPVGYKLVKKAEARQKDGHNPKRWIPEWRNERLVSKGKKQRWRMCRPKRPRGLWKPARATVATAPKGAVAAMTARAKAAMAPKEAVAAMTTLTTMPVAAATAAAVAVDPLLALKLLFKQLLVVVVDSVTAMVSLSREGDDTEL